LAFADAKTLFVTAAPEKILLFDPEGTRLRQAASGLSLQAHHAA
jgi:hypothetical protein